MTAPRQTRFPEDLAGLNHVLRRSKLADGLAHLSRKANTAVLNVDSGNDRATRLYESTGFRFDHVTVPL